MPDKYEGLRKALSSLEERKARAQSRLKDGAPPAWHYAIIGLHLEGGSYAFTQNASITEVEAPPSEIELASALEKKHLLGAISRYSQSIRNELVIQSDATHDDQWSFNLAWWITSLIRAKTNADILVPAAASYSWSVIAGVPRDSCRTQLLEDVPLAKALEGLVKVTPADLDWVDRHLMMFADLLENPRFRLAVESLTTHHLQHSERMMVASLWSGIEAIFGINYELRFRLSALIATSLEPPGTRRVEVHKRCKKLYDIRSKAVHGAPMKRSEIYEHAIEVRRLLGRIICRFVEEGKLLSTDELEEALLLGAQKAE
jgi:hypothetical protein